MTGSEFYTYVLENFKRTDKEDEIYRAITDVIADIRLQYSPNDYVLETTLTGISSLGDYALDLPTDFGYIIGDIQLVDTTTNEYYDPLTKISKEEYDRLYPDRLLGSSSLMNLNKPSNYCIFGNQVLIGPVPDVLTYVYKINYSSEPTAEITSGTTNVPFSDLTWRNILRCGVLMEVHAGMENYQEADVWATKYLTGLARAAQRDYDNNRDSVPVKYNGI